MNLPKYQLKSGQEVFSYEFSSEGHKGIIPKVIQFTLIDDNQVYNLAFGNKDLISGSMDDLAISNNGDSEKILSTVVSAVYAFCDKISDAWIFASGSTSSRTRMYRMGITKYLEEMQKDFDVYGQLEDIWEPFEKDKNYIAFLAQLKTS